MNRRQFMSLGIAGLFGGGTLATSLISRATASTTNGTSSKAQSLFSALDNAQGEHFVARFDLSTHQLHKQAIPFRAHDVLALDQERVLAFGRRPEPQCALSHLRTGEQKLIPATTGRHFYGHGCLSQKGDVLFTTENDYDTVRGVIGLRDTKTLQPIDEYESYGVGPHDIHLMPDGKTLVVANGGIQTHPDFGRRKLNLSTMQPSLVYIDVATGQKVDEYRLDDHQLSIRHLMVSAQGDVGVATQWQGNLRRQQPMTLVAWQRAGSTLKPLSIAIDAIKPLRGYMADLAFDAQNQVLAVTSPRGNQITLWDIASQQFLQAISLPEPSGIAFVPEQQQFLVSSAKGGLFTLAASRKNFTANPLHAFSDAQWDNHLMIS